MNESEAGAGIDAGLMNGVEDGRDSASHIDYRVEQKLSLQAISTVKNYSRSCNLLLGIIGSNSCSHMLKANHLTASVMKGLQAEWLALIQKPRKRSVSYFYGRYATLPSFPGWSLPQI